MTPRALLPALLTVLALAGCSAPAPASGDDAAPAAARTIAALPSSSADPTASRSPSLTEQYGKVPRLRLDMSDAEEDRAYRPYDTCIAKLGGKPKRIDTSNSDPGLGAAQYGPEMQAAERTCAPLQPKPPWEYDRNNPDALRFVRAVVACLHQHGVGAQVGDTDPDGRIGIALTGSVQRGETLVPACQRTAAGAR